MHYNVSKNFLHLVREGERFMWLNENAGVMILIIGIAVITMMGIALWILFGLRNQFCVQKLKFTALYAVDRVTRVKYASLTIGNRSVREIALKELGVKNGRVSFDLTALYRAKAGLADREHIVIEQRSSIDFSLSQEELKTLLTDSKNLLPGSLRLYAIDLTGNLYQGRIGAVRKLLAETLRVGKTEESAEKGGAGEKTA